MAQNVRLGRLDLSFRQAVDPPPNDPSRERSLVARDDLLVTIVGANTGEVCRLPVELPDHFVCQSVALMRPVNASVAPFAELYLVSPEHGQNQFEQYMYGQGRPHLSFEQLAGTRIALPPLAEQIRIVSEVQRRLSIVDEIEATLDGVLIRAARLRQSVLKRAFEGRLVPQDPNDEPASVLLERIRKEREASEVARPKRGRRKS
jgi:type I restriction enzyme S subunit